MIPLAYTISKKNILTVNPNLCHLPYDKYRVVRTDGTEEIPPDVYANTYEGRMDYAREVLECNMRNLVRGKIMEKLGINLDNVTEVLDHRLRREKRMAEEMGAPEETSTSKKKKS
jgi:hypothetical protein